MRTLFILEGHTPKPVSDDGEWAIWFGTADRAVAQTDVEGFHISTAFIGIDHQWGKGPPLLFETMVFGPSGESEDQLPMFRYSTWAEAEHGHRYAEAEVRRYLDSATDRAESLLGHLRAITQSRPNPAEE